MTLVFFKMFAAIVMFGLFYGVACLPVCLSMFGPLAYPAEEVAAFQHLNFDRMKSEGDMQGRKGEESATELAVLDS